MSNEVLNFTKYSDSSNSVLIIEPSFKDLALILKNKKYEIPKNEEQGIFNNHHSATFSG